MTEVENHRSTSAKVKIVNGVFVDEHQREVWLRGVNTGGRSKFAPFVPFDFEEGGFPQALEAYMAKVSSWGCNCLRMPFSWEALEPERGLFNESFLQRYEAMLNAAWNGGMRVLVDFHQDVYASVFSGDGFPLWTLGDMEVGEAKRNMPADQWFLQYMDPTGKVAAAFDRLWNNEDGILDAFENMWRRMAKRFGEHPAVFGFEIINEPSWGTSDPITFSKETLPKVITRIGQAILEESPSLIIAAGGTPADMIMGEPLLEKPDLPAFLYAPHYYDGPVLFGKAYEEREKTESMLEKIDQKSKAWQCPVLFGEFGGAHGGPSQLDFVAHMYSLMDQMGAHATLWEASASKEYWNHEDLSPLEPDGSERPLANILTRPYPRAVAGKLDAFVWDPSTKNLALTIQNASSKIPSELFLPLRHLGASPEVTVSGGVGEWVPKEEVLYLRADEDQGRLEVICKTTAQ